jgi:hypothetical protein
MELAQAVVQGGVTVTIISPAGVIPEGLLIIYQVGVDQL